MPDFRFSSELIERLLSEANTAGFRNATEMTTALRNQLIDMKRADRASVPSGRNATYFVIGSAIYQGIRRTIPVVADLLGLDGVSSLAVDVAEWAKAAPNLSNFPTCPPNSMINQVRSGRVNLSRKGDAHFQTALGRNADNRVITWVDLFVFTDKAAAEHQLTLMPDKKVF